MSKNLEQLRRFMQMDILAGIRIRRWEDELRKNFNSATYHAAHYQMYAGNDAIADAVYRQDVQFMDGIYDDCVGITKLKGTENYKFLKDIEKDDVTSAIQKLDGIAPDKRQDNSFFKFYNRDQRTYFLNAAHLARSPQMIAALGTRGIDFNQPDSEGRLPIFFIARHAQSRWVIPTLCQIFGANANSSGGIPKYIKLPAILADDESDEFVTPELEHDVDHVEKLQSKLDAHLDEPYTPVWDAPLIRAIKYRNRETLLGLNMLPKGKVDWNMRFQWNRMTPLIYAIIRADDIVKCHRQWHDDAAKKGDMADWPKQDYSRWDVANALWMVKFLAAHPQVDTNLYDSTKTDAKGYAYTDAVQRALLEGLLVRKDPEKRQEKQQEKQFTAYPSRRFT